MSKTVVVNTTTLFALAQDFSYRWAKSLAELRVDESCRTCRGRRVRKATDVDWVGVASSQRFTTDMQRLKRMRGATTLAVRLPGVTIDY